MYKFLHLMKRIALLVLIVLLSNCNQSPEEDSTETLAVEEVPTPDLFYGIDLNSYEVATKRIRRGDTFGKLLED